MFKNQAVVVCDVVEHGLCIGCGVCVSVCPRRCLTMEWTKTGDLVVAQRDECISCGICIDVCPFAPNASSEGDIAISLFSHVPGVQYNAAVGFYLASYAAASEINSHRIRGASGGMVTWFLETLLRRGMIDGALCVCQDHSQQNLFTFRVCRTIDEIREASGSKYYPVDIANALSEVLQCNTGTYAVVGLPCLVKAVRLAGFRMPALGKRLAFYFGLVCGHLPNKYYTEYLITQSGLDPACVNRVEYRVKDGTQRAGGFKFRATSISGAVGREIPFDKGPSKLYGRGFFQVSACSYCEDVFAEAADISFMDAWLPEFIDDPRGHSLLVIRHPHLLEVLHRGVEKGECWAVSVPISSIIRSQGSLVANKKKWIRGRLWRARIAGESVPKKRARPSFLVYLCQAARIESLRHIEKNSKLIWPFLRGSGRYNELVRMFGGQVTILEIYSYADKVCNLIRNPRSAFQWLRNKYLWRFTRTKTHKRTREWSS